MSEEKKYLLVVEDNLGLRKQLRWAFKGFEVEMAGDREEAIALVRRVQPGVILLDLGLPPDPGGVTEGFAILEQVLSLTPESKVVVVTGDNDRSNALKAISLGAYDFYQKPVDANVLSLIVDRAYSVYELERENMELRKFQVSSPLTGIIASSPEMLEVCRTAEKVAPIDISVLLLGASGTGKELFAQAIHALSPRSSEKIVAINCAAIPHTLLESVLFGYEKGAFTGATKQTKGKIENAEGGTLFLDEIGDLPLELQTKLLRFLQERVIERVGGLDEIQVDTRIVCATHQNLEAMIAEGRFREDLYYRISDITINIPSLRERKGDALLLAKVFLERFGTDLKCPRKGFSKDAIHAIETYAWPGNVRELESRVKRATIMADDSYITAQDLELASTGGEPMPLNLRRAREELEHTLLRRAMAYCDGNVSVAASSLGIARPTLYKLMGKYGMKR